MERVTEEEVLEMDIEELGNKLAELGWEPVDDELIDDKVVHTVFRKTFNINDWDGLDDYLANFNFSHSNDVRSDIIEDPFYMTYELDIYEQTGSYYFWSLGENPNNSYTNIDFTEADGTFPLVVAMILNGEFASRRETAFEDIWEVLWETDDGDGDIPNVYLTLVEANQHWEGYVCGADYGDATIINAGDYAIVEQDNKENSPKFYYLISKEQAEEILNAEYDDEAFEIMERILGED